MGSDTGVARATTASLASCALAPVAEISAATSPATTGAANDVPLHRARPVPKTRTSPSWGVSKQVYGAVREGVDDVAAQRVDVGGHPEVGEVRDASVAVERADAERPVEGGRPERRGRGVVAGRGHQDAVAVLELRVVEHLEGQRREVVAGAAPGRQVDDLRVVGERLGQLGHHGGLQDPATADPADREALHVDLGARCQAPHDAGDERAVAGVLTQVGTVELVVALDPLQPRGAPVGR